MARRKSHSERQGDRPKNPRFDLSTDPRFGSWTSSNGVCAVCKPIKLPEGLYIRAQRQQGAKDIARVWGGTGPPKRACTKTAAQRQVARIQAWSSKADANGFVPRYKEAFLVQRGLGFAKNPVSNGVERDYPHLCSHRSRGVLFFPNRKKNGAGSAGGQVLPHGVTRRRIRHWGV
ncbi:uncharacterized protein GGS25DRAFT_520894 [Hypoxylon fragiforme]|uniref:uncharacterized protein n=1 Tax=Hypoxylon fragiforme TaxID=63214 RepID=UPI0020C6B0E1|nr:uncharacterized protein GGS25DRAFT_520894 [Hypoxylon fragiforme]KAI2610088.1 hypothetical protein GGS25DRAFT_520894 [Hypoxylon fragiforme]